MTCWTAQVLQHNRILTDKILHHYLKNVSVEHIQNTWRKNEKRIALLWISLQQFMFWVSPSPPSFSLRHPDDGSSSVNEAVDTFITLITLDVAFSGKLKIFCTRSQIKRKSFLSSCRHGSVSYFFSKGNWSILHSKFFCPQLLNFRPGNFALRINNLRPNFLSINVGLFTS